MSDPIFQPFPMLSGRRAQVWRHQPAYRRPRHFHEEPELNIVFKGQAMMGVGNHEVTLRSGDVLFLRPGQDHVMLSCSDDLDLVVLAATPELAQRFSTGSIPAATRPLELPRVLCEQTRDVLLSLDGIAESDAHEKAVGDLFEWALPTNPTGHSISRKVLSALYNDDRRSALEMARAMRVPASDLSRHFSSDLGLKFVDARARLHLMRFVRRVDEGQSLTQAASDHFGSYAQCHRVFRRYVGCAPREFFAGKRRAIEQATFESAAI